MRILVAAADAASLITNIRLRTPLERVAASHGWQIHWESYPYVRLAGLAEVDVLIAQRGTGMRHLRLMQAMRQRGGVVIAEIDDLLTEASPHLINYAAMQQAAVWVRRCLGAAHLVTASTPRLAEALAPFSRHIEVVPNHSHALPGTDLPQAQPDQPGTVLLAASDSLASTALYPVLGALAAERGAKFQMVAVGRAGDDAAAAGLEVQRHPLMPRQDFLALARSLPNAVAVIPLDDSRFSACKSAIKWFDYAEAGIPTLASALPPYADVIEDGRTGALVADTPQAWRAALCGALDAPAWRLAIARQARDRVRACHAQAQTEAAWASAIDRALALREPVGQPTAAVRVLHRLQGALDGPLVTLRRMNRARLVARQVRRGG